MFDPAQEERTWQDIKDSCGIDDKDQINYLGKRNFSFFMEHILGYNIDCPVTQASLEFHQNPEEFKKTSDDKDAIKKAVMAPRGHSKTVSWTISPTLWRAFGEKGKQIIISSASNGQSKDILELVKRIIMRNEALQHLEPSPENLEKLGNHSDINRGEDSWAAQSITTTTDVQIKVKTFGSSIRSKHVDYVFLDDVLQDEGQGTRNVEQEKDTFYNVVSPIIENKDGILQIVGTPMSHNDLLMELMEKDSYSTNYYQAYNEDTREPLWNTNWTYESLMEKKNEVGPARFAREYMCNPMSVEEQFFSEQECIKPNLDDTHFKPNTYQEPYNDWSYYVSVDVAMSDKAGADYSVFTVIGVPKEGEQKHIVDVVREKGMSPRTIADKIERLDDKYGFSRGLVEKNSIGEGVAKEIELRDQLAGRIKFFDTTRTTRPKILSNLQAALHRGELTLPSNNYRVGETLIDELSAFHMDSRGKLKGKGHDDTVMSLAIGYELVGNNAVASATIIGAEGEISDNEAENVGGDGSVSSSLDSVEEEADVKLGII